MATAIGAEVRAMKIKMFLAIVIGLLSVPAMAATDCPATLVQRFWNDSTVLWIYFQGGGVAKIPNSDAARDQYTALAITAFSTGRPIAPRYSANSANCNIERNDFIGLFLN